MKAFSSRVDGDKFGNLFITEDNLGDSGVAANENKNNTSNISVLSVCVHKNPFRYFMSHTCGHSVHVALIKSNNFLVLLLILNAFQI